MKAPTFPSPQGSRLAQSHRSVRVALATVVIVAFAEFASAQDSLRYKTVRRAPGGLPVTPDITSTIFGTQQVSLIWNGFAGPYLLERSANLANPIWQKIGGPTNVKALTITIDGPLGFIRVKGGSPPFAGAETCAECHSGKHDSWSLTRHAGAFDTLKAISQDKNSSCLPCHTVGYGHTSGFKNEATTPYFAGVQCENCHGPGGAHAANPADLTKRPIVQMSAMVCGGCHGTPYHHPTYNEWETSGHAAVVPDVASGFLSTNATTSTSRMTSCGACHSGSVRLAMLRSKEDGTPLVLPSGQAAAQISQVCSTCHDPHESTANGSQLRNPTKSLVHFSYSTATNTSFAAQYNPQVNVCGQCHNMRGALWTDTSRPPHHSPQYNMLIGTGGMTNGVAKPPQSEHRDNLKQCTGCHIHSHGPADPTLENPFYTGHEYKPTFEACLDCHKDGSAPTKMAETQSDIKQKIGAVKTLLNQWATTKSDATLRVKYAALTWEYNNVGQLSNPAGTAGVLGPTTTEQTVIPDNIKQARFNLYLVEHDQSYGVHNAKYAKYLLQVAQDKVNTELAR